MIVEKIWRKTTQNDIKKTGLTFDWETIRWKGWFLFGIVPLFVKMTSRSYHIFRNDD